MGHNEDRSSLRGLERTIFDLVYAAADTEQWAEWLRLPLQHAAAAGDSNLVKKLQRAGAKGSALHAALEGGQAALVRDLVKWGASVTGADENGDSPIHLAAALGDEKTVSFLLEKGALPNALDGGQRSPLHVAAETGRLAAVNALLAAGADMSLRYGEYDDSAMDSAAVQGHTEIVAALIRNGANVNAADCIGATALHEAAYHNAVGVIDILVDGRDVIQTEDSKGWTALHFAAERGSSEAILTLLERGADCNKLALGDHGRTPLHLAAGNGSVAPVKALLGAGANASLRQGPNLSSVLELAVLAGHVDVARHFICHGVDVNYANATGRTALHAAAASNNVAAIDLLVDAGAEVDVHGHGWTPLHEASSGGCSQAVVALMKYGASKSKLEIKGSAPLHLAARNGHVDATNALLAAGADVNIRHAVDRSTPLFTAAAYGHVDVLGALIRYGARVHEKNFDGNTALHKAAQHNEAGAINVLVKAGANVNAAGNRFRWVPLHYACNGCCVEAVIALLNNRAWVEVKDHNSQSPLHLTALFGHLQPMKALLAAGANYNAIHQRRSTALHLAAGRGHRDVVAALLQAGAYVRATDSSGCTALHDAFIGTSDPGTVRLLLEAGATVNAREGDGRTPLHLCASRLKSFESMAVLLEFGANANEEDRKGDFPLHLISKCLGQITADDVDLLLRWGADETALNAGGHTPLQVIEARYMVDNLGHLRDVLTQAPVDRTWRRRGWLLLYRAFPRRVRPIADTGAPPRDRVKRRRARSVLTEAVGRANAGRGRASGAVAGRARGVRAPRDWRGVVTWLVGMDLEGVFRNVVMYV